MIRSDAASSILIEVAQLTYAQQNYAAYDRTLIQATPDKPKLTTLLPTS
jgi:hypothetical protein